jgi:phosphoglycolate phosphatase-like HAD superfamily hydrolase
MPLENMSKTLNILKKIEVLILDFDGVVFSTKNSFWKTIQKTVNFYFLQLLKLKGSYLNLVTQKEIQKFKDIGIYNDDWKLTKLFILYFLSALTLKSKSCLKIIKEGDSLKEVLNIIQELKKIFNSERLTTTYLILVKKDKEKGFKPLLKFLKENDELKALQKIFPDLIDSLPKLKSFIQTKVNKEDLIQKIFEEFYLGKKLYEESYNQPALFNLGKGFIENERPLITIETLKKLYEKFGKLIIYSERPRKQAIYVLEKFKLKDYFNLNSSYFREEIHKFSFLGDPGKPNPTPFFNLLKDLKAENKFSAYVGDTIAEAILIKKLKAKYLTKSLLIIVSKNFSQNNADIILKNVNELSLIF